MRGPIIPPRGEPVEIVECCCALRCSEVMTGTLEEIRVAGWKRLVPSTGEPSPTYKPNQTRRTYLGWCKECAKKYGV